MSRRKNSLVFPVVVQLTSYAYNPRSSVELYDGVNGGYVVLKPRLSNPAASSVEEEWFIAKDKGYVLINTVETLGTTCYSGVKINAHLWS